MTKKKKQPTVTYNDVDITDITADAFEKGGWADVYIIAPNGEQLMDTTTKPEQPLTARIYGLVRVIG